MLHGATSCVPYVYKLFFDPDGANSKARSCSIREGCKLDSRKVAMRELGNLRRESRRKDLHNHGFLVWEC